MTNFSDFVTRFGGICIKSDYKIWSLYLDVFVDVTLGVDELEGVENLDGRGAGRLRGETMVRRVHDGLEIRPVSETESVSEYLPLVVHDFFAKNIFAYQPQKCSSIIQVKLLYACYLGKTRNRNLLSLNSSDPLATKWAKPR